VTREDSLQEPTTAKIDTTTSAECSEKNEESVPEPKTSISTEETPIDAESKTNVVDETPESPTTKNGPVVSDDTDDAWESEDFQGSDVNDESIPATDMDAPILNAQDAVSMVVS